MRRREVRGMGERKRKRVRWDKERRRERNGEGTRTLDRWGERKTMLGIPE